MVNKITQPCDYLDQTKRIDYYHNARGKKTVLELNQNICLKKNKEVFRNIHCADCDLYCSSDMLREEIEFLKDDFRYFRELIDEFFAENNIDIYAFEKYLADRGFYEVLEDE